MVSLLPLSQTTPLQPCDTNVDPPQSIETQLATALHDEPVALPLELARIVVDYSRMDTLLFLKMIVIPYLYQKDLKEIDDATYVYRHSRVSIDLHHTRFQINHDSLTPDCLEKNWLACLLFQNGYLPQTIRVTQPSEGTLTINGKISQYSSNNPATSPSIPEFLSLDTLQKGQDPYTEEPAELNRFTIIPSSHREVRFTVTLNIAGERNENKVTISYQEASNSQDEILFTAAATSSRNNATQFETMEDALKQLSLKSVIVKKN